MTDIFSRARGGSGGGTVDWLPITILSYELEQLYHAMEKVDGITSLLQEGEVPVDLFCFQPEELF